MKLKGYEKDPTTGENVHREQNVQNAQGGMRRDPHRKERLPEGQREQGNQRPVASSSRLTCPCGADGGVPSKVWGV